jgi:hypothetical protein
MTTTVSSSDIAGALDLHHRRGDTFIREFAFQSSGGDPIDLAGYSCRLHVVERASRAAVITASMPEQITLTGSQNNVLRVVVPAEQMRVPARTYAWDLELTTPAGVVVTYLAGAFVLSQDATQ